MPKVFLTLLSFILVCSFPVSAQYYNFQNYTVEDGLPQSQVYSIYQDERSNIWLGTNGGGLARFNGKEFDVYRRKDGLLSDLISEITGNSQGHLVIKTNLGLSIFDGLTFHNYPFIEGNLQSSDRMWMDKNGNLWFRLLQEADSATVYMFDGQSFHNISDRFNELDMHFAQNAITTDAKGNIVLSTRNGVFQISENAISPHPISSLPEMKDKYFGLVYNTKDNKILFTASTGKDGKAYLYSEEEGLTLFDIPKKMGNSFSFFFEDNNGDFWMVDGARQALFHWDRHSGSNDVEQFRENSGLALEGIRSMIQDREGNIWIGTDGNGLYKYGGAKFISFLKAEGLEEYFIWSIYKDSKGNYWFGTASEGILKYDGYELKEYIDMTKPPIGIVHEILEYGGKFLIGSRNGLFEFSEQAINRVNTDFGIPDYEGINDILKTDHGLWFATHTGGVFYYNGKKSENYNTLNSDLGADYVDDIIISRSGAIWFATRQGLSRMKDGKIRNFANEEYGTFALLQITEDHFGRIWAATYGGGICQIQIDDHDNMSVVIIDTDSGLSSDNVYSILTDREGNIWAGCQQGVDKLTLDEVGNVVDIRNYDNYEGFTGFENNGKANYIDDEGKLWFGTINGVMVYNPQMDFINSYHPITNITNLKLFYKDVDWKTNEYQKRFENLIPWTGVPEKLVLPYNKNHLTFEFEGLSYTVPEKVLFQWMLEGVDSEWSPISSRSDAVYSNLSPGDYTFKVLSSNNDGIWTSQPAEYSFTIKPPFWATWWFRLIIILFVVSVILIISWLRNKFIREKRQELEQLVVFKTNKLVQQKNEILEKNKELKQQYKNLELLSKIGRDITANITIESLLESVYKKLNSLMDVSIMGFGLYRQEKGIIEFPRIITSEKKLDSVIIPYDEKFCLAAECLKENKEIIINNFEEEFSNKPEYWNPPLKGKESVSMVFIPLIYNDQPLGVLTVQSPQTHAYNDYHLNILRNIAIYTKIALENANTYEKIQEQKDELSKANKDIVRQKGEIELNNQKLTELNNEKSNIIGIVAHDLKNPLTSALTMASIMKNESGELNDEQKQCIDIIEKSINRMNNMINRLLDIRKIEDKITELKLEKVNLKKIIRDVNSNLSNEIRRKRIELSIEAEELYAEVDPDYAIQVFENLISNAIKFSPPHKAVKVILVKDDGKARTEIIDEGPGLTEEDKKKVFGKFQRLSAKPTGGEHSTGLGLSIVKKYVEAMNGKVWCESEEGKGANFIVEFDRVD